MLALIIWKVDDPMDFVNCKHEKYVPVFYQCGETRHAELLLFLSPLKLHHVEVTRIFFSLQIIQKAFGGDRWLIAKDDDTASALLRSFGLNSATTVGTLHRRSEFSGGALSVRS